MLSGMQQLIQAIATQRPGAERLADLVFGHDLEYLREDGGAIELVDPSSRAVILSRHAAFDWIARMLAGGAIAPYGSFVSRGPSSAPYLEYREPENWRGIDAYTREYHRRAAKGALPLRIVPNAA